MDDPAHGRLSDVVPDHGEDFHELVTLAGVRIEHIVSSATPDPALQVQGWDEWVLVVAGAAELEMSGRRIRLAAGDWILIPSGTAHRVLGAMHGTHWVAVHGPEPGAAQEGGGGDLC